MNGSRRLGLSVAVILMCIFLSLSILSQAFVHTLGSAAGLKARINKNDTYAKAAPLIVDAINGSDDPAQTDTTNVLKSSEGKQAALATFTPQFVQTNVEGAIDSLYDWLDGKAPKFHFTVDLKSQQGTFLAQLQTQVQNRLSSLPVCTPAQTSAQVDPLTTPCVPKGATPATLATQLKNQLDNDPTTLATTDTSQVATTSKHHLIDSEVPFLYRLSKHVWIWWLLSAIMLGIILAVARPLRRGLKLGGQNFLIIGIPYLVVSLLVLHFMRNLSFMSILKSPTAVQKAIVQQLADPLARAFVHDFTYQIVLVSAVITAIGTLMLVSRLFLKKEEDPEATDAPDAKTDKPPVKTNLKVVN